MLDYIWIMIDNYLILLAIYLVEETKRRATSMDCVNFTYHISMAIDSLASSRYLEGRIPIWRVKKVVASNAITIGIE